MFTVIDGIIVALVLLLIFLGFKRGFIGLLAKFLGGVIKIIVAALLTKPIATLLNKTSISEHLFEKYTNKALGISDKFSINLVGLSEAELSGVVNDALADAKIPKLFRGLFKNLFNINPEAIANAESITLAELMGVAITNIVLMVGTFVCLLILIWLICFIAKRVSKRSVGSTTFLARTNKGLGAVLGLIEAASFIFVFFAVVSLFKDFGWFNAFTTFIDKSFIAGPVSRLIDKFMDKSFNLSEIITNWLNK